MNISPVTVKHLSQEEGLFDYEIADQLGCHRVTVTRIRARYKIPRPNLNNRKDKKQVCKRCGLVTYIRRKERIRKYCPRCQRIRNEERKEQKRKYMRMRQQK